MHILLAMRSIILFWSCNGSFCYIIFLFRHYSTWTLYRRKDSRCESPQGNRTSKLGYCKSACGCKYSGKI